MFSYIKSKAFLNKLGKRKVPTKEECEKFVQDKKNIDIVDSIGYTALLYAARDGLFDLVKMLIDAGADINIENWSGYASSSGSTALINAARGGHLDIVRVLIKAGANIDFMGRDGDTALMIAARAGNIEVAKALLDAGADVNIADRYGNTALSYARKNGLEDIDRILTEHGGRLEITPVPDEQGAIEGHKADFSAEPAPMPPGGISLQTSSPYEAVDHLFDVALPHLEISELDIINWRYDEHISAWGSKQLYHTELNDKETMRDHILRNFENTSREPGFRYFNINMFDDWGGGHRLVSMVFSDGDGASVCIMRTEDEYYYIGNYYFE